MLETCPSLQGTRDSDFTAGPNLLQAVINGTTSYVLGGAKRNAIYYALNPFNGAQRWQTIVGPQSGGFQWGTGTDGQRVYVPYANNNHRTYKLTSGVFTNGGTWTALDPATGSILWQTANPDMCTGPVGCASQSGATVANGAVYVGSMDKTKGDPTMFAFNAATGQILWSFASGSIVHSSPAIVNGTLYWGSGYSPHSAGKMHALTIDSDG
jgi:polyvinyl alcohol dehydrogenase (cytochrome)